MSVRGVRLGALAGVLAIATMLGAMAPATAAPRDDYPSWDEVEAARGNEAATESTIARIDALLGSLEAEAARLGDEAVARTAEADAARAALARATAAAESLAARAADAARAAELAMERAGQVAAALYRTGGTDLSSAMLLSGDSDDLLSRLGRLDRVSGTLQAALRRAETETNQAAALTEQADVARDARRAAASTSEQAATVASAAAAAADAAVAAQQSELTLFFDQLAALKNTTAALEQQYRAGQQETNDPGGDGGGADGGDGDGDGGIVVPGGEVNDVAAARAYAFGQLAAAGLGADEQSCLLQLWNRESGWRTNAYNSGSGAYGIPQSLPGSKMAVMGADWRTNYVTQVNWGLAYIAGRYGAPCAAWAHSEDVGWY